MLRRSYDINGNPMVPVLGPVQRCQVRGKNEGKREKADDSGGCNPSHMMVVR